jgi:outer membrane receptor protein involved in Fe transport
MKFKIFAVLIAMLLLTAGFAQVTVTGKVTSDDYPNGLPSVNVQERGTKNTVITDASGNYSITVKTANAQLVFTFAGMEPQRVNLNGSSTADVKLEKDQSSLNEVVVTASRQPIRKLQTVTAVEIISKKDLQNVRPEGLSEMARNSPGIFITNAQGRFRGTIYTRGFPDGTGNGNVYTTILVDGLPTLPTPARPADFNFGMDNGVDKVEVVRGAAATLFGRTSAAGVINAISKTGGTKTHGVFSVTQYSNNINQQRDGGNQAHMKVDGNINGAFSKNWRYNVAGFLLFDEGYRDMGYPDKGGQLRANIDWLLPKNKGKIRFFGGYNDIVIQNMIDIPYNANDYTPASGWTIRDSYYQPSLDTVNYRVARQKQRGNPAAGYDTAVRSIRSSFEEGNYARGWNAGFEVNVTIADGWKIINLFRGQYYKEGTKFNLGSSTLYNNTNGSNFRILIDGDAKERGTINEFRIQKTIKGSKVTHTIDVGNYLSRENYKPETYSLTYWAGANNYKTSFNNPTGQYFPFPNPNITGAATNAGAWRPFNSRFGGRSRIEDNLEDVASFFIGDEVKAMNDKLTINAGFRYDMVKIDVKGYNRIDTVVQRVEKHKDWTASLGANYLLTPNSSVYANIIRAFRMPDYSSYTTLTWAFNPARNRSEWRQAPDGIGKNEIINSFELGYRQGIGSFSFDVATFYSTIKNRLAVFYENGISVSKPVGSNRTYGIEASVNYLPPGIKGLSLRSNFTFQQSEFTDLTINVGERALGGGNFGPRIDPAGNLYGNTLKQIVAPYATRPQGQWAIDLKGKQVPVVPKTLFNFIVAYEGKNLGINGSWNVTGSRYEDPTNLLKLPNYSLINLGAFVRVKDKKGHQFRLDYTIKNVTNEDRAFRLLYWGDNDAALFYRQTLPNLNGLLMSGIPQLPRRSLLTFSYIF